jgi:deoxyribodipyrimidine photo-lyase
MKEDVNVFIFRRDFRLEDNSAFIQLCNSSAYPILPIFIFSPKQITPKNNPFFGNASVEFMIETLEELKHNTNNALQYFYGNDNEVLDNIQKHVNIKCIGYNEDFTPFAKQRDQSLNLYCKKKNIDVVTSKHNDYVLYNFDILTSSKKVYEVFTPFYRKCLTKLSDIPKPKHLRTNPNFFKAQFHASVTNPEKYVISSTPQRYLHGGRKNALSIIKKIKDGTFMDYDKRRDFPNLDATTKLSPYLKFGAISIREAFEACITKYGKTHGLVRELLWREFYANIVNFMPHVLQGKCLKSKYNSIKWSNDKSKFEAWCQGKTGFPIVDAAMICLSQTGWMHNRNRMIVAMFLTKDLKIDWRWGERYFATKLVDYDPSSNNGGWQWSASCGADAQPYFRIFNPWLQSKKYDPDCKFIKKWIPALKSFDPKVIHCWENEYTKYKNIEYPAPIVSHTEESRSAIKMYKNI